MGNLVFIVETWGKCYDLFSQVDAKSPQVKTGGFFYGSANFDRAPAEIRTHLTKLQKTGPA